MSSICNEWSFSCIIYWKTKRLQTLIITSTFRFSFLLTFSHLTYTDRMSNNVFTWNFNAPWAVSVFVPYYPPINNNNVLLFEQVNFYCVESTSSAERLAVTWNLRKFAHSQRIHRVSILPTNLLLPAVDVLSTHEKFACSNYNFFKMT